MRLVNSRLWARNSRLIVVSLLLAALTSAGCDAEEPTAGDSCSQQEQDTYPELQRAAQSALGEARRLRRFSGCDDTGEPGAGVLVTIDQSRPQVAKTIAEKGWTRTSNITFVSPAGDVEAFIRMSEGDEVHGRGVEVFFGPA